MTTNKLDRSSDIGSLLSQSELLRVRAMNTVDSTRQTKLGQFFTPDRAAALIASLPTLPRSGRFKVLDPGAGSGILTAALVERITRESPALDVQITALEIDPAQMTSLDQTAKLCEEWAVDRGVALSIRTVCGDFVSCSTGFDASIDQDFDLVIMNPPYGKLTSSSYVRVAMAYLGWDSPNLYSAFLALGVCALRQGGQLVAITPRSFANGQYFGRFRRRLLDSVAIDRIHIFESRSSVFADTSVLQENIIISVTRGGPTRSVRITQSRDHTDEGAEYVVDYKSLVRPGDTHAFIRIVATADDTATAERMLALPTTLVDLGLDVSTGRVVEFRAQENVVEHPGDADFPLIYPGNLDRGAIVWPRQVRKPQGFRLVSESDRKALVPSGHYVVTKRFSSKEEKRRIVAARWDPKRNGQTAIAFENHLNVFHQRKRGMDGALAWGLCLWLNGSLVDQFFRSFSGHTQVNATDLRSLRYPASATLRALAVASPEFPDQEELDRLIDTIVFGDVTT